MWEGLSDGCRAGLTLERCSQLAAFAIQLVGRDAAAVWLAEDGVPRCAPLPSSKFGAFWEVRQHARGREFCRGEPGSALSGGYATRFDEDGEQLDCRRSRGGLNRCARESKA